MNTKCHIIQSGDNFIAHLYNETDVLFGIQDIDSRAVIINNDDEENPVNEDNPNFGKPFTSEEVLREWVELNRAGETVEFVDEAPSTTEEDEEVSEDV